MYGKILGGNRRLFVFLVFAAICVLLTVVIEKDVSRHVSESLKVLLAVGAMGLALGWTCLARRTAVILLSVLVFVSAANYMRWGQALLTERIDSYDVIHYYLGAKYFDELGYYGLYPAIALADAEAGPFNSGVSRYRSQDKEQGYELRPISEAIENGRKLRKTSFSPERWESFVRDFLHLQRDFTMTSDLWETLLKDRGFNATPAWVSLVSPVAGMVPVKHVKWLCLTDLLFLAIGLLFVHWAYGGVAALWAMAFLFLSYSLRWPVIGWAFFRYDWVCALLVALALIRKNHHFPAGIMAAIASMFRLFPVLWLFGPASKGAIDLVRIRQFSFKRFRRLILLLSGFAAAVVAFEGATLIDLGTEPFKVHAENISAHLEPEELSSRRLGFVIGLVYDGKLLPKYLPSDRKTWIDNNQAVHLFLAAMFLAPLAWLLRNRPDDESFAYGFIPFFMLLTASYYYAVVRVLLIVVHAANMDQARHRVALAILLGLELFSNWAETAFPEHRVFLIGNLAWGLTLYSAYIIWSLYRSEQETGLPSEAN